VFLDPPENHKRQIFTSNDHRISINICGQLCLVDLTTNQLRNKKVAYPQLVSQALAQRVQMSRAQGRSQHSSIHVERFCSMTTKLTNVEET
jgi:hypothetical protein